MRITYTCLVDKSTIFDGGIIFRCKKAPLLLKLNDHLNVKHKMNNLTSRVL